ncbi:MAG TPA: hypothetical protein VIK72_12375 [Clostridiaceae bacterium]
MKSITSKVAYIDGLMEGLDMKDKTKEERVLCEIVSVLKSIAQKIDELDVAQAEAEEFIETLDNDLYDVEKKLFGDDSEGDDNSDDYEEDNYDNYVHLKCPKCNDIINLDKDIMDKEESINCPNCHEPFDLKKNDTLQ